MSRGKQGAKAGRKERHQASQRALKERKRLRKQRAAIHGAMTEAEAIRKRRKKGRDQLDRIMVELGYEPQSMVRGSDHCIIAGREIPGDVTSKYEAIAI